MKPRPTILVVVLVSSLALACRVQRQQTVIPMGYPSARVDTVIIARIDTVVIHDSAATKAFDPFSFDMYSAFRRSPKIETGGNMNAGWEPPTSGSINFGKWRSFIGNTESSDLPHSKYGMPLVDTKNV